MQSKATTVEEYLASLPEDRRAAIAAVRAVILENLDSDYREGMQYGMIGYYVPHEVFPAGYHCDPRQPLPMAALGSQKGYMSLHLMCAYGHAPTREWFEKAWKAAGKKLDMGKACVRFKKIEDVALEVIGEAFRRVPARTWVKHYTQMLAGMGNGVDGKPLKKVGSEKAEGGRGKAASKKKSGKKIMIRKGSRTKAGKKTARGGRR